MPNQAAILTWVDGVQTLVIQTRFESQSQSEAAWVVPAPSVPEVFAIESGVLESARAQFNPRVERSPSLLHPALVVVGLCLVGGLHLVLAAKGSKVEKLVCFLVLLSVLFILLDLGLARSRGLSADGTPKVDVLKSERVGSYDVAVISSPDGAALRDWLTEFGVPVTDAESAVIGAYASEGWCFVASKLHTASVPIATPHPLAIRFATSEPVYPMRLTGVGNEAGGRNAPLELELLVYAAGTVSVPGMTTVASGPLECDTSKHPWSGDDRIYIAHDGVKPLVDGARWGTRLTGSFSPAAMQRDLRIGVGPGSMIGRTVVDREDKPLMLTVACGIAVACVGLLTIPLTALRRWSVHRVVSATIVGCGLAFILSLISLGSVTFVRTERDGRFGRDFRYESAWMTVFASDDVIASVPDARRAFEHAWASSVDPGEPIPTFGRGPGEYSITECDSAFEFRWVNGNGRETVQPFMPVGKQPTLDGATKRAPTAMMTEASKIDELLTTLERSDAIFIRSGSEYDGRRAAEHLRTKLRSIGRAITAEQFIDELASASSLTGKPYQVRDVDGTVLTSREWFRKRLERLEAGN